ncbi:MAG: hypothetical protein SNJ75_19675 [Gemmataceae bacterium]
MAMLKVLGSGLLGGIVLGAASVGAVWWASQSPHGPLARLFHAASHTADQFRPGQGVQAALTKLEAHQREAAGELDLSKGLPDDASLFDPAPIVIPDHELPPQNTAGFPPQTAAPAAAPAPGAPPMRYVRDNLLPMPRLETGEEEQENPHEADLRQLFRDLVGDLLQKKVQNVLESLGNKPSPER